MPGFDHIEFPVGNLEVSANFYNKVLTQLGWTYHHLSPNNDFATYGQEQFAELMLWAKKNDEYIARIHLAFSASSKIEVNCFYKAALESGGLDNGPPGSRDHYGPHYYAAFVIDPDGNNIEAVYRGR